MESKTERTVNVWDTYVVKKNGSVMHFDIIVPTEVKDTSVVFGYGKAYLKLKGEEGQELDAKQCQLCHMEYIKQEWQDELNTNGYLIIEMEGCK